MSVVSSKAAAVLPKIAHKFRVPERRTSTTVSQLFVGIVLVPLVVYLIATIRILFTSKRVARSPAGYLKFVGFLCALLCIMATIVAYWFSYILLFPTLLILGGLFIAACVLGKLVFSDPSTERHE